MSHPRDLIGEYLNELRASLRLAPEEAVYVVAEAEDHLRETTAAGLAAGMTEREAQQAAISAFGSVTAVVRAHESRPGNLIKGRTPAAICGDLFLAAWTLGGIGLTVIGVSGLVVALMNLTLGRAFTGQAPAGMAFPKADCAYWMTLWPGAHTCAAAHMLEASSDNVVLGSPAASPASRYSRRTASSATSSGGTAPRWCWPATSRHWRRACSARAPCGWPWPSSPASRSRRDPAPTSAAPSWPRQSRSATAAMPGRRSRHLMWRWVSYAGSR